jgi:transcriptional regulator with XRE-family HTH domain
MALSEKEKKEKFDVKFGIHLANKRKEQGLTQSDLAYNSEMERSNIARLESGAISPSVHTIYKIAKALGITMEELMKGFDY